MGSLPPGGGFRPALLWLPLLAPPTEGLVGGDDQARAFVAGGRELEEQVRSLRFERDVPDLIDLYRHRHRSMRWASPRWTTPAPNYCSASSPRPMDVGPWRSPRIGHSRLGPLPAPTHHRRQPPGPAPAPRHHRGHQRNAKLQLTVTLSPPEPVPGLYVHPDHRRRLRRPPVRSRLDV